MALTYFAADGSYGDADGLIILDTRAWGPNDWSLIDNVTDNDRASIAYTIANGDF